MDLYNTPISSATASSDADAAADEVKADERRAERAHAFQQSLGRGVTDGVNAGRLPPGGVPQPQPRSPRSSTPAPATPPRQPDSSAFLSPAFLRLQAEGYPLPVSEPAKPLVPVESSEGQSPEGKLPGGPETTTPRPPVTARDSKSAAQPERPGTPPEALTPKPIDRLRDSRNQRESRSGTNSHTDGSAPDPRYLVGSVPVQGAQDFKTAIASPAGRASLPSPEVMQQIVEFATVRQGGEGCVEFQLGLAGNVLGGARIKLSAYGNRRIGIAVKGGRGGNPIGNDEVAQLIDALRRRDVEVVDVTLA